MGEFLLVLKQTVLDKRLNREDIYVCGWLLKVVEDTHGDMALVPDLVKAVAAWSMDRLPGADEGDWAILEALG